MNTNVRYVTYRGEQLPVRISYYAIKKFQEETGVPVTEIDKNVHYFEPLLFYALQAGHHAEGKELKYKREEMEFLLDEVLTDLTNAITTSFPEPEPTEDEVKKKP